MVGLSFIFTMGQGLPFEVGHVQIKFYITAPNQNNRVAKIFVSKKLFLTDSDGLEQC